jgi:hypothetical protein
MPQGPALRIEPRLDPAQRVPQEHIGPRYGRSLQRGVQVVHRVGQALKPRRWIAETEAGSVEGADAGLLRDHGLGLVPGRRPARAARHQNDGRCSGSGAIQIDMAATDIDQLTRLEVGQQPRVLRRGGRRFGLGKDDATDAKQRGGCQGREDSSKCGGSHGCPLQVWGSTVYPRKRDVRSIRWQRCP